MPIAFGLVVAGGLAELVGLGIRHGVVRATRSAWRVARSRAVDIAWGGARALGYRKPRVVYGSVRFTESETLKVSGEATTARERAFAALDKSGLLQQALIKREVDEKFGPELERLDEELRGLGQRPLGVGLVLLGVVLVTAGSAWSAW